MALFTTALFIFYFIIFFGGGWGQRLYLTDIAILLIFVYDSAVPPSLSLKGAHIVLFENKKICPVLFHNFHGFCNTMQQQ